MKNMTIENITKACNGKFYGDKSLLDKEITGVEKDSRLIEEGYLYIPFVGNVVDGHKFIPQVFEKGALVTLSEKILETEEYPYIKVESTALALKDIATFYREQLDCKIIGITGSVGKTTTTANIGAGLSKLGKKVVIIDTDLGLRNLDVVMGMENLVVYNLVDVVEGSCRLKQALIRDSRYENLYLLPSAQTKDKSAVSPGQMKKLTAELKEEFDYILLDCPAGIEQGFQNAIAGADRALVVTTPEVSSIRDADRIIGLLEQNQIHTIDLIINRIRMDMVKRGDMMSVDDVTEILAVPLIGILPDDEQVVIGTNQGEPVIGLDSKAGKGYLNICKRITGTEVSFMNLDTGKGVFSRIAHAFRKN